MSSNPFRTGVFVLSGLILLIITLFLLGLSDLFVQKAKFVTLVQESVQGLDVGSSVRYRGVPVGNVTAIRIQTHDKLIRIEMEIQEQPFTGVHSYFGGRQKAEEHFRTFFEHELANGLRLRLNYAGITGLKYVELDYFETQNKENLIPRPADLETDVFYVYSQPSVFTDMLKTISEALDKVSRIPFDDISKDLRESMGKINAIMNDDRISSTIENVESITQNLNNAVSAFTKNCDEKTIAQFKEQISRMISDTARMVEQIRQTVAEAKIGDTTEQFRRTSDGAENAIAKLERTLDALSMLLDYLNRDPAALLRGKNAKSVDPGQLQ